ncbi:hypothetical protein BX286_6893 [Streptomyces sp. 3211.6]|nr:hypothetical protein BX286_6893 [Streptomyces sp. 3211.6]
MAGNLIERVAEPPCLKEREGDDVVGPGMVSGHADGMRVHGVRVSVIDFRKQLVVHTA